VGSTTIAESIVADIHPRLSVMPCGTSAPNPAELLGSKRFADFLQQLRELYDIIVIDTPPVLAVTDAMAISQVVDAMIVVARSDHTERFALGQTVMQLRHVNAPIIGFVLNCAPAAGPYGGYYGYYGYRYTEYYNGGKKQASKNRFARFLSRGA
jgi:capsular exopolysaccharide synthesis family protein